MNPFWIVHSNLPREGPGEAVDVAWACAVAGIPPNARICDAACGSGGDVAALRAAAPEGWVTAFDRHLPFVAEAGLRHAGDPGVRVVRGALIDRSEGLPDPAALGPFDLIWCAGAVYFEGVGPILRDWSRALRPGGAVAFSAPVVAESGDAEARGFWGGDACDTEDGLDSAIGAEGWSVVARGRVAEAGWEAYYGPLEARCLALAALDVPELRDAVREVLAEIAEWRRLGKRVGYALRVVRPA